MVTTCPYCSAQTTDDALPQGAVSGARVCPRCRKTFEVYFIERPQQSLAPQQAAPGDASSANCAYHANNQAVTVCARCGDFICNLCVTTVEGKDYCPKCFELLYARGALETSQRSFHTPSTALFLSLTALLFGWLQCLGVVIGPVALYLGIRALIEINRRPELPGRGKAIAAIVIGSIGTITSIVIPVTLATLSTSSRM